MDMVPIWNIGFIVLWIWRLYKSSKEEEEQDGFVSYIELLGYRGNMDEASKVAHMVLDAMTYFKMIQVIGFGFFNQNKIRAIG